MKQSCLPFESIRWSTCDDQLPDTDETVLLSCPGDEMPVWPGWWDGVNWFFADGALAYDSQGRRLVVAWAPMPRGVM